MAEALATLRSYSRRHNPGHERASLRLFSRYDRASGSAGSEPPDEWRSDRASESGGAQEEWNSAQLADATVEPSEEAPSEGPASEAQRESVVVLRGRGLRERLRKREPDAARTVSPVEPRSAWLARFSETQIEPVELADVQLALEGLEARGVRGFDSIGFDCARGLLERAARFEGRTSELLLRRARVHVARLAERFEAAAARTAQQLAAAERTYGPLPGARALLARTEFSAARRALRKVEAGPTPTNWVTVADSSAGRYAAAAAPGAADGWHSGDTACGGSTAQDAAGGACMADAGAGAVASDLTTNTGGSNGAPETDPSRAAESRAEARSEWTSGERPASSAPQTAPPWLARTARTAWTTRSSAGPDSDNSASEDGTDSQRTMTSARVVRCAEEYDAAMTDLASTMALARAEDTVPEQAGPYNPLKIASDLLERIRAVSPLYLNSQLLWLGELANMLALPALPEEAPAPPPPPPPSRPAPKRPRKLPRRRPDPEGES